MHFRSLDGGEWLLIRFGPFAHLTGEWMGPIPGQFGYPLTANRLPHRKGKFLGSCGILTQEWKKNIKISYLFYTLFLGLHSWGRNVRQKRFWRRRT